MSRAVANTLLPAARPASTIARPRPRELPVTNHTCAIHPPLSSHPPGYSGEAYQTQDWMRDGYTKGLPELRRRWIAVLVKGHHSGATRVESRPRASAMGTPFCERSRLTSQ